MTFRARATLALLLVAAGCERPDDLNEMENHGRVKPYEPVPFFPDSQSARPIPHGTVARSDGPFTFADGEIVEAAWVPVDQLRDWLVGRPVCPDSLALVLPRLDAP